MTRATRVENFLSQNCNIFSVVSIFKCNPGKANDKFIASRQFLSSDIIPASSNKEENDDLLYTVTRYGPRTSCQRKGLIW